MQLDKKVNRQGNIHTIKRDLLVMTQKTSQHLISGAKYLQFSRVIKVKQNLLRIFLDNK